ncbi:hypothetical protein WAK64_04265 [Bacillus spongiae]|uniref:Fur-regulated basic protein FbpA n=1 Tax=Bacillus spongiae TaxID=2683610 RepID=A0ABU8HAD6_9BACI
MDKDQEFIKILEKCKETINKYAPDHLDEKPRFIAMTRDIDDLYMSLN